MRYIVLENEKPARYPECKVDPSWKFAWFNSFERAHVYATKWLGVFGPCTLTEPGKQIFAGSENGNCYIEIKELK